MGNDRSAWRRDHLIRAGTPEFIRFKIASNAPCGPKCTGTRFAFRRAGPPGHSCGLKETQ